MTKEQKVRPKLACWSSPASLRSVWQRHELEGTGVLASLRSWSPRLGQRAYAAGVLSFRFAVADGVAPARRPRAVSLVKGAARHRAVFRRTGNQDPPARMILGVFRR